MTAFVTQVESPPLGGMPGWGIVADLTPPELITLRRVAVLRRRVLLGLVLVLAVVVSGYALAVVENHRAADRAAAANDETISLTRSAASYASITQAETSIDVLNGQVASVMGDDVDVPAMLADVRGALPASMTLSNVSLTLTSADEASSTTTGLDATGRPTIGTLTISGSGQTLDDLPAFVDQLTRVKGLVNVLPTSNTLTKGKAQFNVTATLTNALYTHRYDEKAGSQ